MVKTSMPNEWDLWTLAISRFSTFGTTSSEGNGLANRGTLADKNEFQPRSHIEIEVREMAVRRVLRLFSGNEGDRIYFDWASRRFIPILS